MLNDDDKNLDKTLNRLMIGGAALTSALFIAGAYDVGYQAGARETETKGSVTVHGDLTINNHSNNSIQPDALQK